MPFKEVARYENGKLVYKEEPREGEPYWQETENGGFLHGPIRKPSWVWSLLAGITIRLILAYEKYPTAQKLPWLYWFLYDKVYKYFHNKALGY